MTEVLSASTAEHDQTVKLAAYERARVPEVWFVHPTDRTLVIYRIEGDRYVRPLIQGLAGKTTLTAVPGVTVDWDRVIAELGRWYK